MFVFKCMKTGYFKMGCTRIEYVFDVNILWIFANTYLKSIIINYVNFKKYFIGYVYDTSQIHRYL